MKKVLALILALVMALSLVACGKEKDPTEDWGPEPEGTIEVVIWTYFGETMKNQYQEIIDAFNDSQTKYHVVCESQGSQAEMNAKISSTEQSELPAMFHGAVENVAMYANEDYCVPIQEFIDLEKKGTWSELDNTWEAIRSAYQDKDGKQIGYPQGYSYPVIYYNKDMFTKAGIDASTELLSFEDLYTVSKKLVDGGYTTYGIGFHPDGFYFNAALGREGIMYYDNDNGYKGTIEKCLYTTDSTVNSAVKTMLGVYQKLHAENLCIAYGSNYQKEIIPQLADGSCAMMMAVVSVTGKVLTAVGDNFEVGIVPMISATSAGKRTGEPAGGTGAFICNNGNKWAQKGAYEFIKFASTADQAAKFATLTGYLAPNSDAYNSDTYKDYLTNTFPAISAVYDSLNKSDSSANNPYIPISNEMKAANKTAIQEAASDPNADLDTIIQKANDTIQEAIDLYNLSNPASK